MLMANCFRKFCGFLMFCIHFLILFSVQQLSRPNQCIINDRPNRLSEVLHLNRSLLVEILNLISVMSLKKFVSKEEIWIFELRQFLNCFWKDL